jgi:Cd2+/Zn2+-exporting ATPase
VLFKGGAPLERAAGARAETLAALEAVGVVVGHRSAGNPKALESADVVLKGQAEADIVFLVGHARRALRVIRQNVTLALATKLAFLVSALFGAAPLWLAVLADTGATVAVTLNGLRLLRASSP